jgi:hypothetical protein
MVLLAYHPPQEKGVPPKETPLVKDRLGSA